MSLRHIAFIEVPAGREPGFDHADFTGKTQRIHVAHTGADRVDVFDCAGPAFLHSLADLPGVAGVLVHDDHDLLFTSDRASARVSVFRASTEELHGRVAVGPHPNGLAYDSRRRRLYAFNLGDPPGEGATASVVDLDAMAVIREIALPGRPRWALYDVERDCIFVNIRDPAEIALISCKEMDVAEGLPVPAHGPHGLWLDNGRLFCAADEGELVVVTRDGDVLADLRLPGTPDVVMHDPELHRLYVAIGEPGAVSSFDTERLEWVEEVATEEGAHTLGLDPVRHHLYVFCPGSCGAAVYAEQ